MRMFKKVIFPMFGVPCAIISDGVSHFAHKAFKAMLKKHGVCVSSCCSPISPAI